MTQLSPENHERDNSPIDPTALAVAEKAVNDALAPNNVAAGIVEDGIRERREKLGAHPERNLPGQMAPQDVQLMKPAGTESVGGSSTVRSIVESAGTMDPTQFSGMRQEYVRSSGPGGQPPAPQSQ
jgi:hypothetical protein